MTNVGLNNYYFITKDHYFWTSLKNVFIISFTSAAAQHIIAIILAFILNLGLVKLKELFRGVMFLPYITSTAAVTIILSAMLGSQYGLVNEFLHYLQKIGILQQIWQFNLPIHFFTGPMLWFSLSFMIFWKWVGWNSIIYLAGLQAIPKELYEQAKIDGANNFQLLLRVTLPLLKPIIFFATSMSIIYGMQIFDEPMIWLSLDGLLSYEGINGFTTAVYMYAYAFRWGKFGVAAASSYLLCIIIVAISFLYRKLYHE